jgi:hypothetical protein
MAQYRFKRTSLLWIAATGLLVACATPKTADVTTYIDPQTGARTDLMSENLLDSPDQPRELIWLGASRVFKTPRSYEYFLEVEYMARLESGFLDIQPGQSLLVTADGQTLQFSGSGSLNSRRKEKDTLRERAIYQTSGHQLRCIAAAQSVRVSVIGQNGVVLRDFSQANTERFRKFVVHFVPET